MENNRIEAVFTLDGQEFPNSKRASIVIGYKNGGCTVGVKKMARVFEKDENGNTTVHQEQHGDYVTLDAYDNICGLFASLKNLLETVPENIIRTNNGDKA